MVDLISRPSRTLSLEMGARRNGRTNTKYVVQISMHPHFHRHHLCSRGPYSGGPERPKRTRNLSASTYASRMHDVAHAHSPAPCSFPSTPGIPNTIEMASRALADSDRHMCLQPSMPWPTLVNQTDAPYQPPHTGSGLDTATSAVPRRTTTRRSYWPVVRRLYRNPRRPGPFCAPPDQGREGEGPKGRGNLPRAVHRRTPENAYSRPSDRRS